MLGLVCDNTCAIDLNNEVITKPANFAGFDELDHALVCTTVHLEADGITLFEYAFAGNESDKKRYTLYFLS